MASNAFRLVMRSGPAPGTVFDLTKGDMVIGREAGCDIVINDTEASRRHARLVSQHGGYVIEDLGSTNGTFVNGQRLMGPHMLRPGELISIGENVSLAYEAPQFDQAVTMPSGAGGQYTPATVVAPQPADPYQAEPPVYSGQVPPGPEEPAYSPPAGDYYDPSYVESKPVNTWLYVGIGCAVVMLCVLVIALFAFDSLNLYCEPPFEQIFNCN